VRTLKTSETKKWGNDPSLKAQLELYFGAEIPITRENIIILKECDINLAKMIRETADLDAVSNFNLIMSTTVDLYNKTLNPMYANLSNQISTTPRRKDHRENVQWAENCMFDMQGFFRGIFSASSTNADLVALQSSKTLLTYDMRRIDDEDIKT